jgi:hypothetical protein
MKGSLDKDITFIAINPGFNQKTIIRKCCLILMRLVGQIYMILSECQVVTGIHNKILFTSKRDIEICCS